MTGDVHIELASTTTCPACGHRSTEVMPTEACQYICDCRGWGSRMKPKKGDYSVFCSNGDVPCPPIQKERTQGNAGAGCCKP